jgi:hypothetical protein
VSETVQPSLWRRIRNSWLTRRKKPVTVDVTPQGLVVTNGRRETRIGWSDITRIDCGTRDTIAMDLFFVVLHTAAAKVTIDEYADGFRVFEFAMFDHWPQLRERWIALQCGPLHQPQFETLWRR